MTQKHLGFIPEPLTVAFDKLLPSRKAPEGLMKSRKFKQILSSIDAVVCQGMGMRAVQKLNEANIKAYKASAETVADIIKKFKGNELEEITAQNACAQHGCH